MFHVTTIHLSPDLTAADTRFGQSELGPHTPEEFAALLSRFPNLQK